MVELPILGRVLHLLPTIIDKFISRVVPKHHSIILGNLHLVTCIGLSLFEVLTIRQHELSIILVAVLRFLEHL